MTVTDQIKNLNRKIMQNEAQYGLHSEDLGLKPSTVEQAKFEYYPLGKIFNKGLDEDDEKEGLFKRLENIKDTNLKRLQRIEDQGESN